MKQALLFGLAVVLSVNTYAQGKPAEKKTETKMEEFSSKAGSIIRVVTTPVDRLSIKYGSMACDIRKIIVGGADAKYFYYLDYSFDPYSSTGAIEYSDLVEINKAMKQLRISEAQDASSQNYLENYFQTTDGFKIGYYAEKGKAVWYLQLEKYGSHNTVFLKGDSQALQDNFLAAQTKIEELKK